MDRLMLEYISKHGWRTHVGYRSVYIWRLEKVEVVDEQRFHSVLGAYTAVVKWETAALAERLGIA